MYDEKMRVANSFLISYRITQRHNAPHSHLHANSRKTRISRLDVICSNLPKAKLLIN